jgi:O-methyltransferase involved in polyketide biosynthesis
MYETMVARDKVWRFGLAPGYVSPLLAEYGWREVEQVGGSGLASRYLEPVGRRLAVLEAEQSVYAEKV